MPPYKMTYFACRGRGEAIRQLLADQGLELEEIAIPLTQDNGWADLKPKQPFGQLPAFQDGDFVIHQSNAILRHLGRSLGLYGKNATEATLIDMLNDGQEDLRNQYVNMIYKEYDTRKDSFVKKLLQRQLQYFENLLQKNSGGQGFLVGDQISFVDYNFLDLLTILLVLDPNCLDALPGLKDYQSRLAARPRLVAYYQTEGYKTRPINGNGKQ